MNYIEIGSVPYDEECAQVGEANYHELSKIECRLFAKQIIEQFNEQIEETGCLIRVKSFQHDFGNYSEVVVYYPDTEKAIDLAFEIESDCWQNWTEESKNKLQELIKEI